MGLVMLRRPTLRRHLPSPDPVHGLPDTTDTHSHAAQPTIAWSEDDSLGGGLAHSADPSNADIFLPSTPPPHPPRGLWGLEWGFRASRPNPRRRCWMKGRGEATPHRHPRYVDTVSGSLSTPGYDFQFGLWIVTAGSSGPLCGLHVTPRGSEVGISVPERRFQQQTSHRSFSARG